MTNNDDFERLRTGDPFIYQNLMRENVQGDDASVTVLAGKDAMGAQKDFGNTYAFRNSFTNVTAKTTFKNSVGASHLNVGSTHLSRDSINMGSFRSNGKKLAISKNFLQKQYGGGASSPAALKRRQS